MEVCEGLHITAIRHTQCESLNEKIIMEIENLKALIEGKKLNSYQKGLAVKEFEKLLAPNGDENQALSMSGVVESADFPSINNEGTPLLDEYGKKTCNCVGPNRTYFPDGAIVCMNCFGEWYH